MSYKENKKKNKWNFFDSKPDPLFPEVDPRIRIQINIKMKWFRNFLPYFGEFNFTATACISNFSSKKIYSYVMKKKYSA